MGSCQPKLTPLYSQQLPGQKQTIGQTKIMRNPSFLKQLQSKTSSGASNMRQIFLQAVKKFPQRPFLCNIKVEDGSIVKRTYSETLKLAEDLAKGLAKRKIVKIIEEVPSLKLKMVGIFSKNRFQWVVTDLACLFNGYTSIPLYDTFGNENLMHVLNQTNMQVCFCSKNCFITLMKLQRLGKLAHLILYDKLNPQEVAEAKAKGLQVIYYQDIIQNNQKQQFKYADIKPDDVLTFCYTSGTTGPPKGALLSHQNYASTVNQARFMQSQWNETDRHLSYLPLAHVMERVSIYVMIGLGASVIMYAGDLNRLKQDIQIAKPTIFITVPRLHNRFYQAIKGKFDALTGVQKCLVDQALQAKLSNLASKGEYKHSIYDSLVFQKVRQQFGGQVRYLGSGSAPLNPEVINFLKVVVCVPLVEAYGQTESCGASFATHPYEHQSGHVGGPMGGAVEFKLVDIPEMKYKSTDIRPRGEICMRGPSIFLGYYKNDQKTRQALDKDGWLHTGDVGQLIENGALKIIDRKKNIFKLQQGEYIAPERVEPICMKKGIISQMFLYGSSLQNFAVAIIVPSKQHILKIGKQNKIDGTYEVLCQNKTVKKQFLKQLNEFTKKQGLQSFEQPKNIYLQTNAFSTKNILTNTLKLQRFQAKNAYIKQIQKMYQEGPL